jgi:hypothetical protein
MSAFLTLLVFIALPSWTALADCGTCADVDVIWEYGPPHVIYFELSVASPTGANIYYTTTLNNTEPPNPTWDASGNPTNGTAVCYNCTTRDVQIPYGYTMNIKAQAWKPGINPCYHPSVNIVWDYQHNPNL